MLSTQYYLGSDDTVKKWVFMNSTKWTYMYNEKEWISYPVSFNKWITYEDEYPFEIIKFNYSNNKWEGSSYERPEIIEYSCNGTPYDKNIILDGITYTRSYFKL